MSGQTGSHNKKDPRAKTRGPKKAVTFVTIFPPRVRIPFVTAAEYMKIVRGLPNTSRHPAFLTGTREAILI
jgi:hypothetical protein